MLLRERINEIRQAKRVPIDCFIQNGISKTKYYRFVSGQSTISVGDLKKILEILTVSFSELLDGSDERNGVIFNEFGDFQELSQSQIETRKTNYAQKYMKTQLKMYYLASSAYEFLLSERKGAVDQAVLDDIYDILKNQDFLTIFEMQIFRIIAPHLTVTRFFKLYTTFLVSLKTYDKYAPADGLELMVKIHFLAMKNALSSVVRAQKYLLFVIDGVARLDGQTFTSEFAIMKRFGSIVRLYLDNRVTDADISFDSFNGAARRLDMARLWASDDLDEFEKAWHRLRSMDPKSIQPSENALRAENLEMIDFSVLSMGEAFTLIMRLKKVPTAQFELVGFNHSKIYRLRKKLADMSVEELLAGTLAARLDVRDIDVYLSASTVSAWPTSGTTKDLTSEQLQEKAVENNQLAVETHMDIYTEIAFKYRELALRKTTDDWLVKPATIELASDIRRHLSKFDEWHEGQHRLAGLLFLDRFDDDSIKSQIKVVLMYAENIANFRFPYNPVLVNLNMAFSQAVLQQNVERARFLYQQMLAAYEQDPKVDRYFAYRWHRQINAQLLKVISYDMITSIAIEGLLHDVMTITGQRYLVEPYFNLLRQMQKIYLSY